jgi:DNA-binding CsgD family transcriptional regulator
MTRKTGRHTPNMAMQPGNSIELASATIVRYECLERLRRVAEDAVNFKLRLFHASEDSAVAMWLQFLEQKSAWQRESSDALKEYVKDLRRIFSTIEGIKGEINENWHVFEPPLKKLVDTVCEIFARAGVGASTHDDETKRWKIADVERTVQLITAKFELEQKKAVVNAFRAAKISIAQEKNRRVQKSKHGAPQEGGVVKPIKKKTDLSRYSKLLDAADLTVLQREVFMLRLERGMSLASIAEHLGKDTSTIREHFRAARRKFDRLTRGEQRR